MKQFLGINITCTGPKLMLDPKEYLHKVLERFNMLNAKPVPTPLSTGYMPIPGLKLPIPHFVPTSNKS